MKNIGKILLILIILVLIAAIAFVTVNFAMSKLNTKENPTVKIVFEGYGEVELELYPDIAPNTVKNFIRLAQRGYYNGKTITNIEETLIMGGLPTSTDESGASVTDGPTYSDIMDDGSTEHYAIAGEFLENGYNDNTLSHSRGVISMYRATYAQYQQELYLVQMMGGDSVADQLYNELYNSQSSGFFIMTEDNSALDATFAAFGRVTSGMEVIDAISEIELQKTTSEDGTEEDSTLPVTEPVITSITVDTHGVDYGMPEVMDFPDFEDVFDAYMSSYMSSSSSTVSY